MFIVASMFQNVWLVVQDYSLSMSIVKGNFPLVNAKFLQELLDTLFCMQNWSKMKIVGHVYKGMTSIKTFLQIIKLESVVLAPSPGNKTTENLPIMHRFCAGLRRTAGCW